MTPIIPTTITVTPQAASDAYQTADGASGAVGATGAASFGATLQRAMQGAIETGQTADAQAMKGIAGGGNLTDVVTAVSKAELTLQAATAIRDKMVAAYQDIMRMAI